MSRLGPGAAALFLLLAAGCQAPASEAPPRPGPAPEPAAAATPPATESVPEPERAPAPAREPEEWVVLETDEGEIWINVFEERTPEHAENFKKLVRQGYYDGSPFHRVLQGFVAQGGGHWAESGLGTVDVGYSLAPEIRSELRHVRGAVAAARLDDSRNPYRRSSGSQFYICLQPQPELDLKYTVFGQVIRGMEVVDALKAPPPGQDVTLGPETASYIRRAWLRPPNEPGSAKPHDHSDHAGSTGDAHQH